mgnify:CR=1 FL=1
MIKQKVKYDRNFNEIEYHELNNHGKIIYSIYTSYHGIKNNPNQIRRIKDSNGWIREYDKTGKLINEVNKPEEPFTWIPLDLDLFETYITSLLNQTEKLTRQILQVDHINTFSPRQVFAHELRERQRIHDQLETILAPFRDRVYGRNY